MVVVGYLKFSLVDGVGDEFVIVVEYVYLVFDYQWMNLYVIVVDLFVIDEVIVYLVQQMYVVFQVVDYYVVGEYCWS